VERGRADLLASFVGSAADELNAAIDNHLRGVDAAVGESGGVVLLTACEVGRGERIVPAEMVPIVDMLFESDDFRAIEGLFFGQFLEQGIGRRATGTAFGSKQFDDDGSSGRRTGRFRLTRRVSGPADQRQDEGCRQSNAGGNEGCAKMHDGFPLKIGVAERG